MLFPKKRGSSQVLHGQQVSTTLKTHHKKFQLNRSRNDWVIKNSKNVWWWVPSKYLVTSDRLVRVGQSRSEAVTITLKLWPATTLRCDWGQLLLIQQSSLPPLIMSEAWGSWYTNYQWLVSAGRGVSYDRKRCWFLNVRLLSESKHSTTMPVLFLRSGIVDKNILPPPWSSI